MENSNLVEKEATGHSMRNSFIRDTYIPKSQRKTILLSSDDL
jgi:hypothetical protein